MINNKFFLTIVFYIFGINHLFAEVSIPKPATNLLTKIALATSFSSSNNNNLNLQTMNQSSKTISFTDLKANIQQEAAELGLAVDEEAMARLKDSTTASLAGLDTLGEAIGYEDNSIPEKTPDTYVYDTGVMTLENVTSANIDGTTTSFSDEGIFSDAAGAQKGRVQVFIDFKRKLFWGDVVSYVTVNANALQDGSQINANPSLGTAAVTALPVVGDTFYLLDASGVSHDMETQGLSLKKGTSLNGMSEPDDNRKLVNHNGTVSTDGDARGGVIVFGNFSVASLSSEGTATIAFEAGNAAASADDDTFAANIERWSATGSVTGKKGEGVDLPRTAHTFE